MDSEPRPEAVVRQTDGRSERPKRDEPCRAGADRKWGTVVVGQLWLADARGQFRGDRSFSRPSAASLAALKGSETRIRSRDRRPSFARTTAGASGQSGTSCSARRGSSQAGGRCGRALRGTVAVGQLRRDRSFSRPSAAPLAALKGSEMRIRSRDRRPSFARTTAGASGPGCGRALGREGLAHWTVATARSRGSEADSLIQLREQKQ